MNIDQLNQELESKNLSGFWKTRVPVHSPEAPFIWKWKDVHDGLMKAKDTIGIEVAERRAIRLLNPNSPIRMTSRSLQFTFSIVNPGETAWAHRHNMTASRFVVQGGKGACTIVEGERFPMEEGDLILTPDWTWHEHANDSNEPIIWLDGLNGPVIQNLNVLFFENYEKEKFPVTRAEGESAKRFGFARAPGEALGNYRSGVPFRYRWKDTYEALKTIKDSDSDPYDGKLLRYVNPVTGGFTFPTMSWEAQLLDPGVTTGTHRHTSTTLFHVFRGRGRTAVGEGYLEWEKGDSFVVPTWQPHRHETPYREEAIVCSINDRPLIEALGLYREETP